MCRNEVNPEGLIRLAASLHIEELLLMRMHATCLDLAQSQLDRAKVSSSCCHDGVNAEGRFSVHANIGPKFIFAIIVSLSERSQILLLEEYRVCDELFCAHLVVLLLGGELIGGIK
jgi:hypothetical protein